MKAFKIIPLIILIFAATVYSQTVVIGTGAEINVGLGVDLCAGIGNISGNISGSGTTCNSPLPVEMMTFSASVTNNNALLIWQTSSEINNKGFEIYRSAKNKNTEWNSIGFVNGNGTKNTPTNYTYTDVKLGAGKYYYKMKQVDFNGNFQYIQLNTFVEIAGPNKYDLSQNYPNPFNPVTKINFSISTGSVVNLKVYDLTGKEISTILNNKYLTPDYYNIEFNASNLASGVYFYRIVAGNYTNVKRMVVLK